MRATCPIHLVLDLITLKILVKSTNYEHPHYVIFSSLLLVLPSLLKYSPQHPVLQYPASIFLPQDERPNCEPIQNNR